MPNRPDSPVSLESLPSPKELRASLPATALQQIFIGQSRQAVIDILNGVNSRLLLVVGPCSIHDPAAALDFADNLRKLSDIVSDRFLLVMRTYFEKPRTALGWTGFLYDPQLNGFHNVVEGLTQSRKLLLDLASLKVPAATEFLDLSIHHYLGDLITWGSIGSRTAESQPHRQMVSSLNIPIGFKNGTDGSLDIAVNALLVAGQPQAFIGFNSDGQLNIVKSKGNPHCHIVLRGGNKQPNYDPPCVQKALQLLQERHLRTRLMIDCSHDNSGKDPDNQPIVFQSAIDQILSGNTGILGMILESHLAGGSQAIAPDRPLCRMTSVTDACLSWEATEKLILSAYEALQAKTHRV